MKNESTRKRGKSKNSVSSASLDGGAAVADVGVRLFEVAISAAGEFVSSGSAVITQAATSSAELVGSAFETGGEIAGSAFETGGRIVGGAAEACGDIAGACVEAAGDVLSGL